jgi:hypothetical protein
MGVFEIRVVQGALTSADPESGLTREAKALLEWLERRTASK